MKIITIIGLSLMIHSITFAQNLIEDMKKAGAFYDDSRISFNMEYEVFPSYTSSRSVQSSVTAYYIWDGMSAYQTAGVEVIANRTMSITVNHDEKVILINNHDPASRKAYFNHINGLFTDTLKGQLMRDSILESNDSTRTWRITYIKPLSGVAFVDICISLRKFNIISIVNYYSRTFSQIYGQAPKGVSVNEKPRLLISFGAYEELTPDKEAFFSGKHIVSIELGNKAIASSKYKTYTISNFYTIKP